MSKIIRISDQSSDKLDSLTKLTGQPKQKVLDLALTHYAYEQTLKKSNKQYAALKKDSQAWKEMQEEHAAFDVTLSDGLEDD
jgi:hypothetical protein